MNTTSHPNFENEVFERFDRTDRQIEQVIKKLDDHDGRIRTVETRDAKQEQRITHNEEGIAALVEKVDKLPTLDDITHAIDNRNIFYVKWLGSRTGQLLGVAIIAGAGAVGKELVEVLF